MKSSTTGTITAALFAGTFSLAYATPLPDGTLLGIDLGVNPDGTGQCTTGSCFGMEVAANFWIWTNIAPGIDGGFIVGKDQSCGGQDIGSSETNDTPGELTAAWLFFNAYGTICADNRLNVFSDTSNDGTTILNDLSVAWNGSIVPMGGGSVDDYTIALDGTNNGWSMNYSTIVSSGPFVGVNFRMITRGNVTLPSGINNPPVVNNVSFEALRDTTANWSPDFTDDVGDTHSCVISANASNGNATVNNDCTGGTYTSGSGFYGQDSFEYTVTDQAGLSASATGIATVYDGGEGCVIFGSCCEDNFAIKQVTTVGGGQSNTVNASVSTTFTGHITTDSGLITGGRNAVKICPGTILEFTTSSSVGEANCAINGAATGASGTLTVGDKLICSNKPEGGDTDRFTIKSGF